jgi:hypothetical protein
MGNTGVNGYASDDELPSYRVVAAGAKGNFSGPFGSGVNNLPIAAVMLEESHRRFATNLPLQEAVSTYEDLVKREDSTVGIEWPADLIMYYQDTIVTANGCHLVQAWQALDRSAFAQIIDVVRNRALSMALDIRRSIGKSDEELENVSLQEAAKVERSVIQNIYGGNNFFSSDNSRISSENTRNETSITANDDTTILSTPQKITANEQTVRKSFLHAS